MKQILLCVLSLGILTQLSAQLSGTITDLKGEALPFASVYIQGSSKGTTSNVDGYYALDLTKGDHQLVFQYVGYKQKVVSVSYNGASLKLDVELEEETVTLSTITVKANAEDPAYAIIRKAIAKRSYYRNLIKGSSCDVYIKGVQRLLDAPSKVLGMEIGDMGGSLDSNRQGIIYLSESLARYHRQGKTDVKEEMISSKLSGNDNGFGFNRASLMDFNLYDNSLDFDRQILSPIADNALSYYRYRLEGITYDESGRLINKIALLPKRAEDPAFGGYIYIVEDLWNIYSVDLTLTGAAIKQPVLDTLKIKQVHVPIKEPDQWMILSQTIEFTFEVFGFKGHGNFTGVFSDYELNPTFPAGFFNNEVFKVQEEANDRSLTYWDSLRPIPLTQVEVEDYVKKDSLQRIWESKEYKDSIDKINNKFEVIKLLFGYQYSNSYKRRYWTVQAPLTTVQYNTVQGYYGDLRLTYRQEYDRYNMRWFSISPALQYGLADNEFRGSLTFNYNFNRTHNTFLSVSGGRETAQINNRNPISRTHNTYWSLLFRRNFLKIYDKDFLKVNFAHEIANGLKFFGAVEYSERSPLENNTDFSYFDQDREFTSNQPLGGNDCSLCISNHKAFTTSVSLRWRPGQKYMSYPGRKYVLETKYPEILLSYKRAFGLDSDFLDYDLLRLRIKDEVSLGIYGWTEWRVEGGVFLSTERIQLTDFGHFRGNQILLSNPNNYLSGFFNLPYYEYSTSESYVQFNLQHHFGGIILDKIPLLRKLNWKSVFSFNALLVNQNERVMIQQDPYFEVAWGFDNVGFKAFRLFRVDLAASFRDGKYDGLSFVLGVRM